MARLWGQEIAKRDIGRYVGDLRQICGAQAFEMSDGAERFSRAVRLYNAAGLDFDVLLDRGMGIGRLTWQGIPLALLSPVGVVHPAYAEQAGLGWLRTWPGGFLTPCGLSQVGSPALDEGEALGQHGRLAALPASQPHWGTEWEGEHCLAFVSGQMRESSVFGINLVLKRKISIGLDTAALVIEDVVINEGQKAAPLMLLQHFNLGYPLVGPSTYLETSRGSVVPRDAAAEPGLANHAQAEQPQAGWGEQVFYHDLQADAQGQVFARLTNPDLFAGKGLSVTWKFRRDEYPVLVQWKNMADGLYVMGVEPANCHVGGRVAEREQGTLEMLTAGEVRRFRMEVHFS